MINDAVTGQAVIMGNTFSSNCSWSGGFEKIVVLSIRSCVDLMIMTKLIKWVRL